MLRRLGDYGELDEHVGDEICANSRSDGLWVWEVLFVGAIEVSEVSWIGEVHEAGDDIGERGAGSLEFAFDVREH